MVRDVEYLDRWVIDIIVARLCQADAVEALTTPAQEVDGRALTMERAALVARQEVAVRHWARGDLSEADLLVASQAVRERLADIDAAMARSTVGPVLGGLLTGDPVQTRSVWDGLSLDRQRAIVAFLLTVIVQRVRTPGRLPKHLQGIDPDSIRIVWRDDSDRHTRAPRDTR